MTPTDADFLHRLETRAKDKRLMFLATSDEMERLHNIGRSAQVPPPKPCIKRGVVLEEIKLAYQRLQGVKHSDLERIRTGELDPTPIDSEAKIYG